MDDVEAPDELLMLLPEALPAAVPDALPDALPEMELELESAGVDEVAPVEVVELVLVPTVLSVELVEL